MALPPDVRGVLLDIEGTTSSISYVHDVMFPFAADRLEDFLSTTASSELADVFDLIAKDAGYESCAAWQQATGDEGIALVTNEVRRLMAADVKATGLKALQGLIWKDGFESGILKAHIYPDVIPAIKQWRASGIDVRIYSSGSVAAQKLFFGHLDGEGDCLSLFSGHYDTTTGGKKEPDSYTAVANDWELAPQEILFISDIAGELTAAAQAGFQARASVRPGNAPLPSDFKIPTVQSFEEL